jgi:hypothetical protein
MSPPRTATRASTADDSGNGWVLEALGHEGIDGGLESFVRERYNGEGKEHVYVRVWAERILCVHSSHREPSPTTAHSFCSPIPHVTHSPLLVVLLCHLCASHTHQTIAMLLG